jgi:VWFA-related protein
MNRFTSAIAIAAVLSAGPAVRAQDDTPAGGQVQRTFPSEAAQPTQAGEQESEGAAQPIFKAQSDLVVLHVNVFDKRSDAVPDLPQSAFLVFEDDRPQEITFFASGDVPVAVGLVLDNSSSMIARRGMVVAGTTAFANSSHPEDEVFSVIFNEHVRYGLPAKVPFTRSSQQVIASLNRFPPRGRTAFYDAVISALNHLKQASHQKRVLVVLSDGGDNASRHTKQEMLDAAAASDAIIYTVAQREGSALQRESDPGVMKRLAEVTGGAAYFASSDRDVIEDFEEIALNIRRGYSIGYVPPAASGNNEYRRVRVMVRAPDRRNLTARVRHGYSPDSHTAR